tara:strand:+ start:105 stop:359 length:255 start_codon:yes stop_codon:yes gene_type:complete
MDKKEVLKYLGLTIKNRRKELGITQNELGLRIKKDQQAIHRLETGGINPSFIQLLEICRGLELSIGELIDNEGAIKEYLAEDEK